MERAPTIELGPYRFVDRLGEGGMGQVWRAEGPDGPVAVKILGPAADLDDAARARLGREIAALRGLRHPHLVPLLDHGVDDELGPYLVLPLLPGVNLRDLVAGRAICPEAAILLAEPIAAAAAALHAAGYVHRDLKPENVIAGPGGEITVIDLGLAWREGMTRHTETGAAVGSIGYMAPEQIEGRAVGPPADVWALGVMLHEWVAGRRPFARARPTEEAAAALIGAFPRLTAADRRADDALAALVARCLAAEPAARPRAEEVAAALAAMIDWAPPDGLVAERAAVCAEPAAYQARIAPLRVRRLERLAREALAAGRPFAALALCDRALAYAPERAELEALVAEVERATAAAGGEAYAPTADLRAQRPAAAAETDGAAARPGAPPGATAGAPVAAPAPTAEAPARRSRRGLVAGGAVAAVVAASVITYVAVRDDGAPGPAPGPAPPSIEPTTSPPITTTAPAAGAEGIARDLIDLFGRAMAMRDAPAGAPAARTPTTAQGWLDLAATQPPADALVSVRRALALQPSWLAAQEQHCRVLVELSDAEAVAACDEVVRRRPDDPGWLGARGIARYRSGDLAGAISDLDGAVAGDPDPRWLVVRALARSRAGDRDGARADLVAACALGSADACSIKDDPPR